MMETQVWERLLADYQLGLDRFALVLEHKTRCWQTLPWKLALLCEASEQQARRHAKELLREFDEQQEYSDIPMHPDTAALAHRLKLHYLSPGDSSAASLGVIRG